MQPFFGTGFLMAKYWYFSLRLYYIRKEQDSFRTEMYKGLMNYVQNKAPNFVIEKWLFYLYHLREVPVLSNKIC